MKGDKECEDHRCEALTYCHWHPDECMGKPWSKVVRGRVVRGVRISRDQLRYAQLWSELKEEKT